MKSYPEITQESIEASERLAAAEEELRQAYQAAPEGPARELDPTVLAAKRLVTKRHQEFVATLPDMKLGDGGPLERAAMTWRCRGCGFRTDGPSVLIHRQLDATAIFCPRKDDKGHAPENRMELVPEIG